MEADREENFEQREKVDIVVLTGRPDSPCAFLALRVQLVTGITYFPRETKVSRSLLVLPWAYTDSRLGQ